ncbi:PREDICTED: MAM and LDL-receptor class A domain-containing protein 1-like [Branchiostoma belcheri]|uniref:MAM and LDL-receptor class A domain-containing protein 1-like n=1 Tax=Branchiostoma belcheri TaxID=7741 RepID=A0A6P4YXK3_BRABE|nr:PREDICTED: MAM and LDL-receptor class A domain-containing protein 1-like [Branchiostoma belcheri]
MKRLCLLTALSLLSVGIAYGNTDPCMTYRTINQARRTSAASRVDPDLDICDIYLDKDWYRFTSYTGGEIPTSCVDVESCSTEAPVWMNGSLPTTDAIVNRTACANLGFGTDCCTFSWDIRVKRCSDAHGLFYVYELEPTPFCPMAYCAVDGNVRLVDGDSFGEGRIEVYFNHEWGSICNSGWTKDTSDVICDQLGYGESQWFNRFWHECLDSEFPCHNGVCVPLETYCDFNNDCGDTSDENNCNHYPGRCNFQNGLCNWIQPKSDDTDWLRIRGSSGVSDQAPPTDHQARADGYYLYIAGHLVHQGTKNAELLLPQHLSANGSQCKVLFHYYMTANVGELHLSIKTKESIRRLWQQNTSQGNKWNKEQVTVTNTEPFQVSFEGIVRAADTGSIAIDDVTLTSGCLIESTDCQLTEQSFQCRSGECVSHNLVCNYEDNCVDSSDEGNACNDEIGRCDFQEDFCSWSQDPDDDFDFVRGAETTDTENTGPITDHTHKSPFGFYAYIEASRRQAGQIARLISPAYTNSTDCQFRFFYHMSGHHIGQLRVLLLNQENGRTKELWSLQGDQGRSWSYGSVSINKEWGVYSVILEAIIGNGDQGDIALDDVSFATYCTPYKKDNPKNNGSVLSTGASIAIGLCCCLVVLVTVAVVIFLRKRGSKSR